MTTVPIEQFGKDHWSLLAYIETVCVDNKGVPDLTRMRCNPQRHPGLVIHGTHGHAEWCDTYSTRLFGFFDAEDKTRFILPDHDDHDCMNDFEAAGLVENIGTGINPVYKLTVYGLTVSGWLRQHKAQGGGFASFKINA